MVKVASIKNIIKNLTPRQQKTMRSHARHHTLKHMRSMARLMSNLPNHKFNLFVGNKKKINNDHFWGCWKVNINDEAYNNANHKWSK